MLQDMAEPENLVLREIRELRRDFLAGQEAVASSLRHLKAFADTLDELAEGFDAFRNETRTAFRELRSDVFTSDNNSLNRHNDLLKAMERLRAIEDIFVDESDGDDDDDASPYKEAKRVFRRLRESEKR